MSNILNQSRIRDPQTHWWPGSGIAVSIVAGIVLLLFGILTGRLAAAGIALPLLLGSGWAWLRQPTERGRIELSARAETTNQSRVGATVRWQPGARVDGLRLRVSAPGHRSVDALVAGRDQLRTVDIAIRSKRTGRRPIFTVDHGEISGQQLFTTQGDTEGPMSVTVLPRADMLREVPLPYRLQGLTGPHDSRRAGDGNDLRDINLFTPGDRLRRIDWRVTARRNGGGFGSAGGSDSGMITDLYVRRSYATADAAVMLVLDSRDEVGPDLTTWNDSSSIAEDDATSLDHARTAAMTLARRYLQAGDRVGLEDLGRMRRPMPPAGGMRQLQRLTLRIALAEPEGEPRARRRAPRLPSGALIIICSTFLDDETGKLAQLWHGSGHRVIAVDVLPEPELRHAPSRLVTAYRIIEMERHDRLTELSRSGIEVISWEQAGTHPLTSRMHRPAPVGLSGRSMPVALATLSRKRVRR